MTFLLNLSDGVDRLSNLSHAHLNCQSIETEKKNDKKTFSFYSCTSLQHITVWKDSWKGVQTGAESNKTFHRTLFIPLPRVNYSVASRDLIYVCHNPIGIKLITRLRLGLSHV